MPGNPMTLNPMTRRRRFDVFLLLFLGLGAAACGTPRTASTAAPAAAAPAPAPAAAPALAPEIESRVYVRELGAELDVFPTVFAPRGKDGCIRSVHVQKGDTVLDIGTGTGLLGLIAAKEGAGKVVATDINAAACRNARHNAKKLGFESIFEVRQVSFEHPEAFAVIAEDEKFDVIIADPPFRNYKPREIRHYATGDYNFALLRSILAGAEAHLTERGKLLLFQGFVDGISLTFELAQAQGLEAKLICPAGLEIDVRKLPENKLFMVLFEITRKR